MALPLWGCALACPVRTVGGKAIGRGRNAAGATRRPPQVIAYSVVLAPAT